MKVLNYRVLLRKEPEGGYTVTVPSLPGCVTHGATLDEALAMAKEAVELYLDSLRAHGEEIPTDESTFEYTLTVHDGAWTPGSYTRGARADTPSQGVSA